MIPDMIEFIFENGQGIEIKGIVKVTDGGDTTCYELKSGRCVFVRKNWIYAVSYPEGYKE